MIDFSLTPEEEAQIKAAHKEAEEEIRPLSRYYDEHEHEDPAELQKRRWERRRRIPGGGMGPAGPAGILVQEENSWGDVGLMMSSPGSGLGGAAVMASGTKEQVAKFLKRYEEDPPKWGAMAMTEPGAGSDTSAISTTAVRDWDHWILNGEKIFVTSASRAMKSGGLIVVWRPLTSRRGGRG